MGYAIRNNGASWRAVESAADLIEGEVYSEEPPTPVVIANPVPLSVTMRQARMALFQQGLLDQVSAIIAGMPSPDKEAATIEWEYSQTVERDRPLVMFLGSQLGLTNEQVDQLFITAATL